MRAEVSSPTYLGGVWDRTGAGIVDPGKLGRGLLEAALRAGVRVHEGSPATALRRRPGGIEVVCAAGFGQRPRAPCWRPAPRDPSPREIRRYVAPIYDYVLVTEPLSAAQREEIGWRRRQGLSDMGNRFHYYRPTADGRDPLRRL